MWSEQQGQFKVGTSEDVMKRVRSHRTACPDIEFIAAVQHPSAGAIEDRLKGYFAHERVGLSEWLQPSARVRAWVERFRHRPNTANDTAAIAHSYPTPDLWPWSETNGFLEISGQAALDISLGPYVPRAENGVKGQTSAISEDWYTPSPYVEAVRELFGGTIDLDPASCAEANLTVRAENIYTAEADGLRHKWFGKVFLNPPWGRVGRPKRAFVKKALEAWESGEIECAVLALNSNATTSAWFQPLLAYPVCFPNHRVPHYGPGGAGGAPNSGTVFVYLGSDSPAFVRIFRRFGAVLHPLALADTAADGLGRDYDDEDEAA